MKSSWYSEISQATIQGKKVWKNFFICQKENVLKTNGNIKSSSYVEQRLKKKEDFNASS